MIHKITFGSNPRLLLFYAILAALPFGGIMLYSNMPGIPGAIGMALSFFLAYKLFRFAHPFIKTHVITTDSDITVALAKQEIVFPWSEITLSGKCIPKKGRTFIFLYHLGEDRIVTIPYEYTNMAAMESALAEKTTFETFQVSLPMDIREILHDRYHSDKEESAKDEEEK